MNACQLNRNTHTHSVYQCESSGTTRVCFPFFMVCSDFAETCHVYNAMTDTHRSDLPLQHVNFMYSHFASETFKAQEKGPGLFATVWVYMVAEPYFPSGL